MRVLVLVSAVAALCAFAAADAVPFQNCGKASDLLKVNTLDVSPWPPQKGANTTVTFDGDLSSTFSDATYTATVKWSIFSKSFNGDLCDAMKQAGHPCPPATGDVSLSTTLEIPSEVPSGTFHATVSAKASDGSEIFCGVFDVKVGLDEEDEVARDVDIKELNAKELSWTAGHNKFFEGMTYREAKKLLGTIMPENLPWHKDEGLDTSDVPEEFDSRTQWPGCVHPVRDQQKCGSCWAFAASEALSDRYCIATNGSVSPVLSPEQLVSCDTTDYGCQGGYLDHAWKFIEANGLVEDACFPYTAGGGSAPACQKTCSDSKPWKTYDVEAGSASILSSEAAIQKSIMSNGPIEAAFTVYQDFFNYKSGVYVHTPGSSMAGGHAIEIVGWGVDSASKLPFWICKNSWNTSWGEDGYFKIKRGSNECGIESQGIAGVPDVHEFILEEAVLA